ncbi:hypothetical protein QOZ99_000969 [Angulomicrobium amanitiforme]|uniref:Uncharacterized protein n=1 Tax=Ancylobacter amanitiformis TaxID=217069 RepID=A0ABU0LNA2_9HYPH|nr:hypothetical protein [Ancylobacter amanitiformis]
MSINASRIARGGAHLLLTIPLLAASLLVPVIPGVAHAQDASPPATSGAASTLAPVAAGASKPAPSVSGAGLINDYPTVARADYVFGCMAANGQSRQSLEKCSCSIDTIATILPYEKYVEAETILSVGQVAGQQAEVFRSTAMFRDIVADLRRAQAEAEITCFY